MSVLVFRLRNVPSDEADAVRQLLDQEGIDWFETDAGNWGIAMPGLWVRNEAQTAHARACIDAYQQQRQLAQREALARRHDRGEVGSFLDLARQRPVATIMTIGFCVFVVYAMISPFIRLATSPPQEPTHVQGHPDNS